MRELPSELEARLQLLTYFLYGLVEYINEIKQQLNKSDVLALMIKQYVEEHYCQDLSLIYSVKLTLNFSLYMRDTYLTDTFILSAIVSKLNSKYFDGG